MELTLDIADLLRNHVVLLGHEVDRLMSINTVDDNGSGFAELIDFQEPGVPFAELDLRGIMVILKPENWEVNRGDPAIHRPKVEWRLLSDWIQKVLPKTRFPLAHSSEFDFGFVHRLDVPSSGLIIAGKTFAGHSLMRFQLDTHELEREYVVLVVDACEPEVTIDDRLSKDNINMRSYVNPLGVPARTRIKTSAHAWPLLDPDVVTSLICIKILTGRHHQIRAHVTHHRHPPIADGKYALDSVILKDPHILGDMMWFESFFHRPVVPFFHECGPNYRGRIQPFTSAEHDAPHIELPECMSTSDR